MSQDLTSEEVERAPSREGDGMYQPERTQRETLLMVLRQSAEYERWMTLAELAFVTRFPPASISAQLRHLRKAEYAAWRIEKRRREWVTDFALARQAALEGPEWASRKVLFRLYYLGSTPYERARHFGGLSERGWVNWSEEIRRRCGAEILKRGMFPPRKYFSGEE